MDDLYWHALQALSKCTFLPGSWDKRFVRNLSTRTMDDPLSEKQIACVKRLAFRYRKQIRDRDQHFDDTFGLDWTFDALEPEHIKDYWNE